MFPFPGVMLNQEVCSAGNTGKNLGKNLGLGSVNRLVVTLTNNSSSVSPVSLLVLEPYSFSDESRTIVRNLSGSMLHSGNMVASVPKVCVGRRG